MGWLADVPGGDCGVIEAQGFQGVPISLLIVADGGRAPRPKEGTFRWMRWIRWSQGAASAPIPPPKLMPI
jgi:hypothetical protein